MTRLSPDGAKATLSIREAQLCKIYALSAESIQTLALEHGVNYHTFKSVIRDARAKYARRGIDAGSRLALRRALAADELL